eukprot:2554581-Prymnesium_polylepis.1
MLRSERDSLGGLGGPSLEAIVGAALRAMPSADLRTLQTEITNTQSAGSGSVLPPRSNQSPRVLPSVLVRC